jgi:hypothetical protein
VRRKSLAEETPGERKMFQFLFIGSRLISVILSDLTLTVRSWASLSFHLHLVVKRTCTQREKHRRQKSPVLEVCKVVA